MSDRDIEFHLAEIRAWRAGHRSSPGCPINRASYDGRMLDTIAWHERQLISLGYKIESEAS